MGLIGMRGRSEQATRPANYKNVVQSYPIAANSNRADHEHCLVDMAGLVPSSFLAPTVRQQQGRKCMIGQSRGSSEQAK